MGTFDQERGGQIYFKKLPKLLFFARVFKFCATLRRLSMYAPAFSLCFFARCFCKWAVTNKQSVTGHHFNRRPFVLPDMHRVTA